jgi:hypothetical protein
MLVPDATGMDLYESQTFAVSRTLVSDFVKYR